MAVTAFIYGPGEKYCEDRGALWLTNDIRVALTSGYTPQDAHEFWSAVVANEIANGNGYTSGGLALANKTAARVGNMMKLSADPSVWKAVETFSATCAVIYDRTPATDATRPLITGLWFGGVVGATNDTFRITWADGIVMIRVPKTKKRK